VTVTGPSALPVLGREDRFAPGTPLIAGFDGDRLEFAVPLADLGPLEIGDRVRVRLVDKTGGGDVALTPTAGPGLIQVPDISDVEQLITVSDPTGDDHGPGTYTYPLDGVFAAGSYDLTGFSVGVSGDDIVFTLDVLAPIQNPWNSPTGLSIQTFDIYVDEDPGAGTGARLLIPGRNAALAPGDGWEYGITVEGWDSAAYVADADGTTEETKPTFATVVVGDKGRVMARIPRGVLGDGDPAQWGYAVAVMSQEGFPSSGVRRVRDVQPSAEQWRIGGGSAAVNATRIMDVLWPEDGGQEALLGEAPEITSGSIDDLGPDDFGTIPLNVAG
jgi:carbohydrate-binding DOMON domain-containing protein